MSWNTAVPEGVCSHQVSHKLPHSEKSTVHFCQLLLCEQRQAAWPNHIYSKGLNQYCIWHNCCRLVFSTSTLPARLQNSIYPCKAWLCHSGSKLIIDFLLMISPATPAHSTVDGDFVFYKVVLIHRSCGRETGLLFATANTATLCSKTDGAAQ